MDSGKPQEEDVTVSIDDIESLIDKKIEAKFKVIEAEKNAKEFEVKHQAEYEKAVIDMGWQPFLILNERRVPAKPWRLQPGKHEDMWKHLKNVEGVK